MMIRWLVVIVLILVGTAAVFAQDEGSDGRINNDHGDLIIALYTHPDDYGNPTIQGYCINKRGRGLLRLTVTSADINAALQAEAARKRKTPRNVLVKRARGCKAAFYVLTNGQYQVNIGPDPEGKTWIVVFDTLEAKNVQFQFYNIYGEQ